MPFANDLLEQSRHLANREPKRPKQASLRRAVSTAYYALFHLLITETTRNWKRPAERFTLARMFEHTQMGKVCTTRRDELNAYFNAHPAAGHQRDVSKHLHVITDTFVQMLQHRHTADYDSSKKWGRTDTLAKIGSVEVAFESWATIRTEHDAQNFLVTLLLKERKIT
jgi:uncharacterized protein (UPF0332 family)